MRAIIIIIIFVRFHSNIFFAWPTWQVYGHYLFGDGIDLIPRNGIGPISAK